MDRPLKDERDHHLAAMITHAIAAVAGAKVELADFLPDWIKRKWQ